METEVVVTARTVGIEGFSDEELFELLSGIEGIELYEFRFEPGHMYASAKRWKIAGRIELVLSALSSIVTIASVLSLDTKQDSKPTTIVTVENAGINNTFVFGDGANTQQELVKQLKDSLAILKLQLDIERTQSQLNQLRNSPRWKRVK